MYTTHKFLLEEWNKIDCYISKDFHNILLVQKNVSCLIQKYQFSVVVAYQVKWVKKKIGYWKK